MNFDFFKYKNKIKPQKGRLLISEPFLPDPNFERSVVLLCQHNSEGTFGFVLNKPSIVGISEILTELDVTQNVFIGGPVQQDTLHYLHRIKNLKDGVLIENTIYWGGDFDELVKGIDTHTIDETDIRFFLGYSGWEPGQLEKELKQNSWIVCDALTPELIFNTDPTKMWRKILHAMGGRFSIYSNYPTDPNLN